MTWRCLPLEESDARGTHEPGSLSAIFTRRGASRVLTRERFLSAVPGGSMGAKDKSDFVLFVNFTQHYTTVFDESISLDGVLTWQSQPSQDLNSTVIQELIAHEELGGKIYFFLQPHKTNTKSYYYYMGELVYKAHDEQKLKPVHFKWVLDSFPIPGNQLNMMELTLTTANTKAAASHQSQQSAPKTGKLTKTASPAKETTKGKGLTTADFTRVTRPRRKKTHRIAC